MPTNPFNEYPINLGRVLALAYGIDARPYDTELQLWVKVAESLGASVTPYDDLDAVLSRIADAGGATPCPPCPPCPAQVISAEPTTEAFLSQVEFQPSNWQNAPMSGVTSVTIRVENYLSNMDWEDCPDLISLSLPELVTFGDGVKECMFVIVDLPNFTTLSVPNLQTFDGGIPGSGVLIIDSCAALTSLSFPALVSFSSGFRVTDNPSLTSVSLPVWVPSVNCNADFSLNALTQSAVDHILARHVASPAWGSNGEALDLSGGTNSAPGAQGLLDVATLTGRGAAVDTN